MQSTDKNKVTMSLSGKPIILRIVEFMKSLGVTHTVVVVGFARDSVEEVLKDEHVTFSEQKEQLGTGHAVEAALRDLSEEVSDVLVVYGDDGVIYNEKQRHVIDDLIQKHEESHAAFTFLTIEQEDPQGLGRIVRDEEGRLIEIVEEKDATDEQRLIKEINPGCFIFKVDFLKKYLPLVEKSPATGEYYLTSLIDLGLKNGETVETLNGGSLMWRGVNTPEELEKANELFLKN